MFCCAEQLLHKATHLRLFSEHFDSEREGTVVFRNLRKTAHRHAVQTKKSRVNESLRNFKISSCDILHEGKS